MPARWSKGFLKVLADLGYFAFPWFDWLTDEGYIGSVGSDKRPAMKSFTALKAQLLTASFGWVLTALNSRTAWTVQRGQHTYNYITNVLEPNQLPPLALAELYARRWDIEMAFRLVKQHLGLHLLWSAKPIVVQQQVLAVLIISQALQALRLEIAWRTGVDPFEVSLPLLVKYAPYYASQGRDPIKTFVERGRQLGFIRPSRRT